MKTLFGVCVFLISSSLQAATGIEVEAFAVKTQDGLATLHGEFNFPAGSAISPLVVMVAGTGLFDRDVHFGEGDTEEDLIFKKISQSLVERGIATLRFDFRGVTCNPVNSS